MPPRIVISKSLGAMPDEVDGLRAAAKGGEKRTGKGRFQRKLLTKDQEKRAKAAEAARREQASQNAAASTHQRSAAELTTLRVGVECLKKDTEKLTKRAKSVETQLDSERQRSRRTEERGGKRVENCACREARDGVHPSRVVG
jgi:hypothetical protein